MPALRLKQRCSRCHDGWANPADVYAMITPSLRRKGIHRLCPPCMEMVLEDMERQSSREKGVASQVEREVH